MPSSWPINAYLDQPRAADLPVKRLEHLLRVLEAVEDPRDPRGRVHPLPFVLALALLTVTAGATTSLEISEHAADLDLRVLDALDWRPWSGTPSRWTFDRVLARVDAVQLDQVLCSWAKAGQDVWAAAVDGKTMRGAVTEDSTMPQVQVVAVTSTEGAVLGQQPVTGGNENAAATGLLARLGPHNLDGVVMTADAKHTGAPFVAAVEQAGAFWLLPVKGSNPVMRRRAAGRPWAHVRFGAGTRQDAHGRRETRSVKVLALGPDEGVGLLGAAQVVRVHRYRRAKGEKALRRTVYYLTILAPQDADPVDLAGLVRGHWAIENKLHHVRDTVFDEDRHRARTGNLAANHAVLRNTALTLHRAAGATRMKAVLHAASRRPERVLQLLPVGG